MKKAAGMGDAMAIRQIASLQVGGDQERTVTSAVTRAPGLSAVISAAM